MKAKTNIAFYMAVTPVVAFVDDYSKCVNKKYSAKKRHKKEMQKV